VRRILTGLTQKEVTVIATHVNQNAMAQTGYIPGKVQAAPTIKDGILQAIKLSKGNDATRKGLRDLGNLFIAWMAEHHPDAPTWDRVMASQLQGYVNAMERDGLAHNTITHRLVIVKTAWRLMYADHPSLVRALSAVRRAPKVKSDLDCLGPAEVAALLDWLREHVPALWPMATLEALCGLRIFEAAALRVQDVDLDRKVIHVTTTPLHAVKNASSDRVIPICDEAAEALRALRRLPDDRRRALVLRFVDEMSTAEIAGVLGRSEGAVRVLIHRALGSVARELGRDRGRGGRA